MRIAVLLHAPRLSPVDPVLLEGIAPRDLAALRLSLALARQSAGETIAVHVGPPQDESLLTRALAAGAHRALRMWSVDTAADNLWSISRLAATGLAELEDLGLVLAGDRSANWSSGMMGPAVAHHLGLLHVSGVVDIRLAGGGTLEVDRLHGDKLLSLRLSPPALLTTAGAPANLAPAYVPEPDPQDAGHVAQDHGAVELFDPTDRTPTAPKMLAPSSIHPLQRDAEMLPNLEALVRQLQRLGIEPR